MIKIHPISFQPLQYSFFNYITMQNQYNYISTDVYITYLLKMVTVSLPTDQLKQLLLDVNSSSLYTLITEDNSGNIQQGILLLLQYVIQTTTPTSRSLLYDISHQWLTLIGPYEIKTAMPIMKKISNKTKFRAYSFDEPTFNPLDENQLKLEWDNYNYSLWRKWSELKLDSQYKHQSEMNKDRNKNNDTVDNIESETPASIQMNPLTYCQLLLTYLKTPSSVPLDLKQRHVYRITHLLYSSWQKGEFQLFQHILHILLNSWSTSCSISDLEKDIIQSSVLHDIIDCWLQLSLYTKNDLLKYFNLLISSATTLNNNNNNNNDKIPSFTNLILKLLKTEGNT